MPAKKTVGGRKQPTASEKAPGASKGRRSASEARSGRREEEGGDEESRAKAFDDTKPQGAVDPGKYYGVIEEFVMQEPDDKGQSARVKYGIANDGEFRGQQVTQFYKVFESDGSTGKGAAFLKKDLAVLGYGDVKFLDLDEAFKEIVDKDMGVVITVKQNGQWTNVYLGGLAEDGSDVIDDYLQQRTF